MKKKLDNFVMIGGSWTSRSNFLIKSLISGKLEFSETHLRCGLLALFEFDDVIVLYVLIQQMLGQLTDYTVNASLQ